MKTLITAFVASGLLVATVAKGAQVYTPPVVRNLTATGSVEAEPASSWTANTLYVRGGNIQPRVELRTEKAISELDIADVADAKRALPSVELARLDTLVDPLIGESFSNMSFNPPASAVPRKQLLAIAWLFAIGLIGMATVGRRKKL